MTGKVGAVVLASAAFFYVAAVPQRRVTAIQASAIPLEVGVYVDVASDWRDVDARISTCVVGRFLRLTYRETSALSLAGIDVALSPSLRVGAELRYRFNGN
jgi:hypothetical protein